MYKKSQNEPTYCKNCRNLERTKDCEQWGCTNTIHYKLGWSEVPRYCRNCESKRSKGFTAKTCSGSTFFGSCGKLIWVPPGKNYTMCQECSERDRAEKAAKWKEKRCEGFNGTSCPNIIKYNIDWDKVPSLCPSCIAKAKAKREADKAKWKEKPCAGTGCRNTIKYNTDWDHPPNLCNDCKEKRLKVDKNDKGTFQAKSKDGTVLFTFGRCSPPRADRLGGDADRRREWASRGYYWVSLPGNPHETFIVDRNPVVGGFLNIGDTKDISYSTAALRSTWAMLAIAIASNS